MRRKASRSDQADGTRRPGDHFDGVGWGKMTFDPQAQRIDHEYMMWRKEVLATAQVDSGSGDNDTHFCHPAPKGGDLG